MDPKPTPSRNPFQLLAAGALAVGAGTLVFVLASLRKTSATSSTGAHPPATGGTGPTTTPGATAATGPTGPTTTPGGSPTGVSSIHSPHIIPTGHWHEALPKGTFVAGQTYAISTPTSFNPNGFDAAKKALGTMGLTVNEAYDVGQVSTGWLPQLSNTQNWRFGVTATKDLQWNLGPEAIVFTRS